MNKKLFILGVFGITVLLSAGTLFLWLNKTDLDHVTPMRRGIVQAVYATGEVEPTQWAKISPQISGMVSEVFVKEGVQVTQGQDLLQLEDSVECAKASEYLARLHFLEKEKDRYRQLSEADYTSKSKYEQVVSEYDAVKAQLEAQNEVVGRMLITAPFTGTILERNVEPGETISMENIVLYLGRPDTLRITAEVDEEDIPLVKTGQKALIKADAFPNQHFEGSITEITPRGHPIDKNFRVRLSLPPDTPLMIGMTVEVNIITRQEENALVVPAQSVRDGKVWVVDGRRVEERNVRTGIVGEDDIQILDGVSETDIILLNPAKYVGRDG